MGFKTDQKESERGKIEIIEEEEKRMVWWRIPAY